MQNFVFVLDTTKKPLNPVHPGQARRLLKQGKAAVLVDQSNRTWHKTNVQNK